jgi:tRNA threonylcarbamoyladenosine biosynthesis protein TsaB
MIILGIDTSGYANAVGTVDGGRVLSDAIFPAKTDSLEQIVDNIDSVLKSAGLALKDVDGIGVGLGPGSWTGIRVGVTVGKMLAFSAGKPVCGISTLEALAHPAAQKGGLLLAVISAGIKDAVYAALYRSQDGSLTQIGDYYAGDIKGLTAIVKEPVTLIGAGAQSYAGILEQEAGNRNIIAAAIEAAPHGAAVAQLALKRLEKGESDDSLSLTPLYLKESTAKAFTHNVHRYKE